MTSSLKMLAAALVMMAQAAPLPRFDVASVKQNTRLEQPSNNWRLMPGRIDYHNSQLFRLIRVAWGDNSLRVEGGPAWISESRYDVVVQFPVDTPTPTIDLMMRDLLIDRFKLAAHLETRPQPVYSLVLARPDRRLGSKLGAASPECDTRGKTNPPPQCARVRRDGGIVQFGSYDMTRFARVLTEMQIVDRPIVDKTGLSGSYRIDLSFAPPPVAAAPPRPDAPLPADDAAPSIFTALPEQLGLKLEPGQGSVEVLVIDHIETPTPD